MDNQKDDINLQESVDNLEVIENKPEVDVEGHTTEEVEKEEIDNTDIDNTDIENVNENEQYGEALEEKLVEEVEEEERQEEISEEEVEEEEKQEKITEEAVEEEQKEKITEEEPVEEVVEEEEQKEKVTEEEPVVEEIKENDTFDVDDIKLEEIDLEQIKKDLEENNNNIEEELEQLERNILQQSDIFETEVLLDAIIKDQELLDSIENDNPKNINSGNYQTKVLIDADSNNNIANSNVNSNANNNAINNVKSNVVDNNQNVTVTHEHKKKKTYNKAMSKVLVAVTAVFFSLIVYIVYFLMFESKTRLNNPYNERSLLLEETVVRGKILSNDNQILAQTIKEDGEWIRHYPYGPLFAHVVGRYDKGKTGIELGNDFSLVTTNDSTIDKIVNDIKDEKSQGNGIVTTLNYKLQKVVYDALGKKRGAVVAIEPSTGKILAMVSKPSYDPNFVAENWSVLSNESGTNNRLINRATSGLYPPGSTYKIVTTLALIRQENYDSFSYKCVGNKIFNGYRMRCYGGKKHGNEDLRKAFANSCNGAFGTIGVNVGKLAIIQTSSELLFNKKIDYNYGYSKSRFMLTENDDETMLAQTAVGQGNTQITPFHNALIASAIANRGVLMKPYLVDRIIDGDDNVIDVTETKKMKSLMTLEEADILADYMKEVVNSGTATSLKNSKYDVAGKTGSAEYNQQGDSHGWFVGFAPASNPTIAFSIIVEDGGTGATSAVPIAKKMLASYIK